ncbi:MAG: outer membrane lipid asymmetry maintenance protein MlaD [Proteobacteria bacterium]|nr:outer membrane lipid asymmetry maintenance protein MlaD [Pseudomonadota bacterium]MDA1308892.1 outer membrane lipid asymmetry maintenance protein MlaD [Pseudomonadota bacterium]
MQRNMIETLMGAVVLVAAAMFLVLAYSAANLRASTGYEIKAPFNKIGGVKIGSDVRVSGINVGSVTDLTLDPQTFRAIVTLTLDDAYQFTEDTTASIASEGLLGGNYIELVPGGSPEMIRPGESIEYTQDSVDIVQLLGRFIFSVEKAGDGGTK